MSGIGPKENSHTSQISDYRRSAKEARDNFDKRVSDLETRSENLNKKRDQVRNNTIAETKQAYDSNLKNQKDTLEKSFLEKRKILNDKMDQEKRIHAKNTGDLTKKYYERLEDINESHMKNSQELERNYRDWETDRKSVV